MRILILHEKHGTYYWPAETDTELYHSALKILTGRFMQNAYYYEPDKPRNNSELSLEEINKLPNDSKIKDFAIKNYISYIKNLKCYDSDLLIWEDINKAVKEKDGKLAWQCLRDRSDCEYERVKLAKLETKYY